MKTKKPLYLEVKKKILNISSECVCFINDESTYTFLKKRHQNITIWKITKKGIFVLRPYAKAYRLV